MNVGDQLPWLRDVTDYTRRPRNWRDMRRNRVVFFAHPDQCVACATYARALVALGDRLTAWDSGLWLVGATTGDVAPGAEGVVRVTGDADRRLRDRGGLSPGDARVVVADRYGQIWQTATADEQHVLVDAADVLETTKWIAIQCPECETLDQPAADWSSVR